MCRRIQFQTGHFTQVVWKESTVLGIGWAEITQNGMKCAYIVGRYKPAGNLLGQFQKHVRKGSFDDSYCASFQDKSLFEEQGQEETVDSTVSAIQFPVEKTGHAEFRDKR